jgi:hypothetical protein
MGLKVGGKEKESIMKWKRIRPNEVEKTRKWRKK